MNCKVMGIINVTPDSFSDGGKFYHPNEAIRRAINLVEEGAEILDFGGESTRPGATPLTWEQEWERIEPVAKQLDKTEFMDSVRVSIDTYHPETAERAINHGARIINCVKYSSVPEMIKLLDKYPHVELALPVRSAKDLEPYRVYGARLYLDPAIGFGTTREEDLWLLRNIPAFAKFGRVLVGASRKRIVKRLTGTKAPGKDLAGNLTIAVWAAMNGAQVVRVHDVWETVQALRVLGVLTNTDHSNEEMASDASDFAGEEMHFSNHTT